MENTNEFDKNLSELNVMLIEIQNKIKSMKDMNAAAVELLEYKQNPYPKDAKRLEVAITNYIKGNTATSPNQLAAFVVDFLLRMDYPNKDLKSLRNWLLNDIATNA